MIRIGQRVGINADTLRGWCKQAAINSGERPGTTTGDARRLRELEAEARELKRANEILLAASSFFAVITLKIVDLLRLSSGLRPLPHPLKQA